MSVLGWNYTIIIIFYFVILSLLRLPVEKWTEKMRKLNLNSLEKRQKAAICLKTDLTWRKCLEGLQLMIKESVIKERPLFEGGQLSEEGFKLFLCCEIMHG